MVVFFVDSTGKCLVGAENSKYGALPVFFSAPLIFVSNQNKQNV